jgi:hypothetical protein
MPQDFLRDLDDPSKANAFILAATTPNTSEINRTRVASQIYLAYKTKLAGESLATSVKALAEALERSLANHAKALREAAEASEKYARGLNRATWVLTLVTALLFLAGVAQVWVAYKGMK